MTFLLLQDRAYVSTLRLDKFMGVSVESWTPSPKVPPVSITKSRYILVDEWG